MAMSPLRAMMRKVVRSKRTTSEAEHILANVVRCLERMGALGMRVWTMRDHALRRFGSVHERKEELRARDTLVH